MAGGLVQRRTAQGRTAFHRSAQRSIALALFYGTDNENVPVHFVSIVRVFLHPQPYLWGCKKPCFPLEMALVDRLYCIRNNINKQ